MATRHTNRKGRTLAAISRYHRLERLTSLIERHISAPIYEGRTQEPLAEPAKETWFQR